ncbi:ABC transporter ATP-binding protein [Pelagivirga sediminicola]|uniref:ABC transporter ATP-binding protein n=1 Tax=Pelagivirga sediminicola TaxID=2170575 RepID=A0A2T7GC57_9RHOB|nr:ABC transporter ATP-binding protein [Pelagivirga sediminicola]PVA11993.1 ABC transporter ATP-binding protein [Pelagivirga sediminicola]
MSDIAKASGVVVSYRTSRGALRALDGADLAVRAGETLAVVGESGSGKSTLGMAMGRVLPAEAEHEAGRIEVDGTDVFAAGAETLRALRRDKLGFVFQNPMTALDPTMRVGRQVARAMPGRPGDGEIAAQLTRAELPDPARVMRAYPHELSGGMAQRVVIAIAIARSPRLLIADEPTASLDASIREKVMATLRRLRDESGASLLVLSHDLRLMARHADRVAVMYGGRVVEIGPSAQVLEHPAHPYTRALLAAASGSEQPGERLEPIAGTPPTLMGRCEACSFAPRCAFSRDKCSKVRPEPRKVAGREVICHFAEEVLESSKEAPQ